MNVAKTGMKKFEIIMFCDNGLPIKRFIDGFEDTSSKCFPNHWEKM